MWLSWYTRDKLFKSSHWKNLFTFNCIESGFKIKEKESGNDPIKNIVLNLGSGCGSVGRVVAANTGGARLKRRNDKKRQGIAKKIE